MSREGQKGGHDPQKRIEHKSTESARAKPQPYASETNDYTGGHIRTPDPGESRARRRGAPARKG